jgi:hypothetical protein
MKWMMTDLNYPTSSFFFSKTKICLMDVKRDTSK